MLEPRTPSSWDDVFMEMCKVIAKRSKDPNTQVGAVIVDTLNRIVSVGFNGPPKNIVDTMFSWERPEKYTYIKHAEDNALWFGSLARGWDGLRGACLYVSAFPCPSCMLSIVRAEIGVVVYDGTQLPNMMLPEEQEKTKHLARLSGVELRDFTTLKPINLDAKRLEMPPEAAAFLEMLATVGVFSAFDILEQPPQEEPKTNEEKEQETFLKEGVIGSKWG